MRRSRWNPRAHQRPRLRPISRRQKWLVKRAKLLMDRYAIEWGDGMVVEYIDETVIIFF